MRWKFKKLLVSLLSLFSRLTNKPIITAQQKKKPKQMVVFWGTPNNYSIIDKDVSIEYRKNRKNF